MSPDNTNDITESLRRDLLGPETTSDDLFKKLDAAEKLLSHLESEYQKERDNLSSLAPIWFDPKAIASSVIALAIVLIFGIYSGIYYNMQSDIVKLAVPLSIGIAMIPFIVFSAKNNYHFQKQNAVLSSKLSEMMRLRSKITLLQEKQLKLGPVKVRKDLSPLEIIKDIIGWLEKTRGYANSILEIPEYEWQKYSEANAKARQIIKKANDEYSIPKWRRQTVFPIEPDLYTAYDKFVGMISNPDSINIEEIKTFKDKIEGLLSKYYPKMI